MPDLKTPAGLLAYAEQLRRQTEQIRSRPGCAERPKR
jgi:hypothetical protein